MNLNDFEYNNEEESDMGQIHAIHNNLNHIMDVRRQLEDQARRPSMVNCVECGEEIPKARRVAVPGVECCVDCQSLLEK